MTLIAISLSLLAGGALLVPPAGAKRVLLELRDRVQASTTLARLNQKVVLSAGTFVGTVNDFGRIKGDLRLPDTTTTMRLAGIGLADVTIGFPPTKAVRGSLNLGSMSVRATATQLILIRKVAPLGLPVNLVGTRCSTSNSVAISFHGQIAPTGIVTVSGVYTVPPFSHCQGVAAALDLAVSGPGNTFTGTLSPRS